MTKLIAETAWHHEGDYLFMKQLVTRICETSSVDIVKLHITLDLDEYMSKDHDSYETLKSWMLSAKQWEELIGIVRNNGKELCCYSTIPKLLILHQNLTQKWLKCTLYA